MVDVRVHDTGSIIGLVPITIEAQTWIEDNVQAEPYMFLGSMLCVEHRMADAIINGMVADGLTVE